MKTQQKILILLVLNLTLLPSLIAQEKFDLRETTKRHEISIGVADLFSKPDPVYYSPYYAYDMALSYYPYYNYESGTSPKLALRYKFNMSKIALRAGFDFAYQDRENDSDGNELENKSSQMFTNFKLGVEFHNNYKRVQLFYGLDFFHAISVSKSKYESNYGYYDENGVLQSKIIESENENRNSEFGISPLLGINYFFNENLSLGVETNYMIGKYKNEYENTNDGETYKSWNQGINARFGPIGILSLNVHF